MAKHAAREVEIRDQGNHPTEQRRIGGLYSMPQRDAGNHEHHQSLRPEKLAEGARILRSIFHPWPPGLPPVGPQVPAIILALGTRTCLGG